MKIAFTICSNNYLAQAKVLCDSLILHNPDYKFYFFLVDEKSELINYSQFLPGSFVTIRELEIDTNDLISRYNIIELNTSIKATCFKYLFKLHNEVSFIHYFDPDIQIFSSLEQLDTQFNFKSILITPHITRPLLVQDILPNEPLFLRYGLYNLGYIGLKNFCRSVVEFLDWWEERTLSIGYDNTTKGLFVDQLWLNYAPIYWPNDSCVINWAGLNVAPWNLQERKVEFINGNPFVNGEKLIFYHFSSYKFNLPERISKYYNYSFKDHYEIEILYGRYRDLLEHNNIKLISSVPCAFYPIKNEPELNDRKKLRFVYYLKQIIPPIFLTLKRRFF